MQLHPSTGGAIGLRDHQHDLVLTSNSFEGGHGELRRAEENDFHARSVIKWRTGCSLSRPPVRDIFTGQAEACPPLKRKNYGAVVVVTGGVSAMVVVGAPVKLGGATGLSACVIPSPPVEVSAPGSPIPCPAGVSDFVVAACDMSGGAFW